MYCLKTEESESKRAKGVQKIALTKEITFDHYKTALFENKYFKHEMTRIASTGHKIYAMNQLKISLSPFDDKRYILEDKISTLAHGHYTLKL